MDSSHFTTQILLCALLGYALGNFNPAYLIVRRNGHDVRTEGSDNAGASNAFLIAGKAAFFIVALAAQGKLPPYPCRTGGAHQLSVEQGRQENQYPRSEVRY